MTTRSGKQYQAFQPWDVLANASPRDITEEMCIAAIQETEFALSDIPDEFLTEKLCMIAVKAHGAAALYYIPQHLKTKEMCTIAVEQNAAAVADVPNELKTVKMCASAIQQDPSNWKYVPEERVPSVRIHQFLHRCVGSRENRELVVIELYVYLTEQYEWVAAHELFYTTCVNRTRALLSESSNKTLIRVLNEFLIKCALSRK